MMGVLIRGFSGKILGMMGDNMIIGSDNLDLLSFFFVRFPLVDAL